MSWFSHSLSILGGDEDAGQSETQCQIEVRRSHASHRPFEEIRGQCSPVLLINSITHCLASDSSPDVKRTVRGLLGEKSCIHDIGILLIDFTSRAPMAISATISLDVRPFNAARDRATPARLRSGSESICALVASTSIRPCQSIPVSASGTFTQRVARITISHSADCCLVPAQAL